MPRMCGIEWPYTSASRIPTCFPSCASATARFADSVDLPTPPLPLQTASTRVDASSERPFDRSCIPPRSLVVSAWRSSAVITSNPSATRSTPGTSRMTFVTCSWKESRSGQPATVSAIVTRTSPPSISTSRTMSSSVTGLRSSGSITRSSARRISSRFGSIPALSVAICEFVTWVSLVWRNLLRRPARTALTATGVALGVGLIVALLSLATGVKNSADELIHVGRADFGLFQEDVSDFSRSLLPESIAARVADVPGVAKVAKLKLLSADGFFAFGLEPDEFVWRRLVLLEGRFPRAGEAIAGDSLKRSVVRVGGKRFRVVGVYHSGDEFEDAGAVLPLRTLERLAHRADRGRHRGDQHDGDVGVRARGRDRHPARGGLAHVAHRLPDRERGDRHLRPRARRRARPRRARRTRVLRPHARVRARATGLHRRRVRLGTCVRARGRAGRRRLSDVACGPAHPDCSAPSSSLSVRSARPATASSLVTRRTVIPRSARSRSIKSSTCALVAESSAPVGSSASSSRGSFASARA